MPGKKWWVLSTLVFFLVGYTVDWSYSYPDRALPSRAAQGFSLKDLDSKKVSLSDFRGKVVLINFFATWCPPCRMEIPELVKIYHQNKKKGLVVLGISLDTQVVPFMLKSFAKQMKIPYPILIGTEEIVEKFQVSGVPTTFVITKEGKPYKRFDGLVPNEFLEGALKELLETKT